MSTALSGFDPLVAEWFRRRFASPTEPQVLGWPEIRAGHDVLISAPTGSGKTLAAFLICLDGLVRAAREGRLEDRVHAVYVSPLKALSNDIRKNLETPLEEIYEIAAGQGLELPRIRTAVRTGDTPAWERQGMLRDPPHVLVTTPESLFILLTAARSREMLRQARVAVVDEIHAIADDKRGSHLALSLARLDALAGRPLQRIGLSATVKPLDAVARFLSDEAKVVDIGHRREMELGVEVPRDELGPVASNEMWSEIYDRLAELIRANRTTLVFVNTRRLAERAAKCIGERLGQDAVLPHHGSLSRRLRLKAEERLKSGELRCVVATASLELGIDIGTVDLVCQIGSPRSIGVSLQRFGRSGHWVGAKPKARLFATTRDELIECAAIVRAIREGELDRLEIPEAPLDILAQQIVAETSAQDWGEDALYGLCRRAWPYRNLGRRDFDDVVEMLSEGMATSRGRSTAWLHRDKVNHRVRGRRGARLAAITSGGAIPETSQYAVVAEPDGIVVGSVDEDFAVESIAGDIFLLGTTSWRIRRIEAGRVRVEDAQGAPPGIPFWRGEAPGRTPELSREVARVREEIAAREPAAAIEFLMRECALDRRGAEQAAAYVRDAMAILRAVPTDKLLVAERFFDEAGGMQLVIHAPFGARINRAWGLALRKRFCRTFNFELQAAATDNGINISLTDRHSFPLEAVFDFVKPETARDVLTQALLPAPMFAIRWRWNAGRALAILRFRNGTKVPPQIQRMRSEDLLAAVFPDQVACAENLTGEPRIPDHPLVRETIDNCLNEAMDLGGLIEVLEQIRKGAIRTTAIDTPEPSAFSHEILNANPYAYLDDAPLEERRARAVQLRRTLRTDVADGAGVLDAAAIAEVEGESWPVVRDADELHDALLTLVVLPAEWGSSLSCGGPPARLAQREAVPHQDWQEFFDVLAAQRRAASLDGLWVSAERLDLARRLYPSAGIQPPIESIPGPAPETAEECAAEIVRGWMESTGPQTARGLSEKLRLPVELVEAALHRLESEGGVLRGRFTGRDETEWCHRRLLARIHRIAIGRLRKEIEPVTTAEFLRFLARWQHVAPGSQLHGVDGAFQIIRQLQGYEIPAAAWELRILPRRVAKYQPEFLDRLCLSGEVMWGRLSPHPAFDNEDPKRVRPTRAAPVAIFLREDAGWLAPAAGADPPVLSHPAREVFEHLRRSGASFFGDLVRGVKRLPSEVEDAVWELLAAGLVTADGFENLRALVDPKRRRGEGRGRLARPRHAAGRWALLRIGEPAADVKAHARQLLARWGVVFRDLLARETLAPAWRDLLVELRRMEAQGEIRGGRFVAGFIGEQFALPDALDALRALRRQPGPAADIEISTADPLNLAGILLPGPRISSLSAGTLKLTA